MKYLALERVSFVAEEREILRDIDLSIEKGDYLIITGPSGSGKSTVLKILGDLISPTSGQRIFKDRSYLDYEPTDLRKKVSYCLQKPVLFGETVWENLEFPYKIRDIECDKERMKELLDYFQLASLDLSKDPQTLSGGEAQRISLIRSILVKPEVLLLDEVTSSLDQVNQEIVLSAMDQLHKEGMTIVEVTHNLHREDFKRKRHLGLVDGSIDFLREGEMDS